MRPLASVLLAVALLLTFISCNTQPGDVLGFAYIAPTSVNLRPAITDRNSSVAVLTHGERIQILEVRRRFARIRSEKGVEGWIDSTQLLTPDQMGQIRKDTDRALALPSEGSATVFEALNIHIDPNRQSPAFARIPDAGSVEVLAHKMVPKVTGPPPTPVFVFQQSPAAIARKERRARKQKATFQVPRPEPPKAPDNWLNLSAGRVDGHSAAPQPAPKQIAKKREEPQKPVVMEDWSLVRTKNKQCGWVLSRNLIMSIPDEVAQYAEGKRITSYFNLGVVVDEDKGTKHNWLWTTASQLEASDFDGWRVFLWNRRRHRYETSYRERDVEGYFPVHVDDADSSSPSRNFQLTIRDEDGKLWLNSYAFDGVRVHLTGRAPYDSPLSGSSTRGNVITLRTKPDKPSWLSRQWSAIKQRLSGGT